MKQPPVQGVQISSRIRNIRLCALDTTMTLQERKEAMTAQYSQAVEMLQQYFSHFLQETEKLE